MAFGIHHVHLKTRDPKQTMQFYVDNLGATLIADVGARGYRVRSEERRVGKECRL